MALVLVGLSPVGLVACDGDAGPKRLGATCGADDECASGLCIESTCLDPEADGDGDGLVNRIEGALGTSASRADTDADGEPDGDEVGSLSAPADADQDTRIDAVESATADSDGDCIRDEVDGTDDPPPRDQVVCCISAADCTSGLECVQGRCVAHGGCVFTGCATGQVCDPESGLCRSPDRGGCVQDSDCDGGRCLDGRCF